MNDARPWVDGLTIDAVLRATAARCGPRLAAAFPAQNWQATWAELEQHVEATARGLWAAGIRGGDHVAVWSTNIPQWIMLQFATARLGAVLVTINPAYRATELGYVLEQSDAAALFLLDEYRSSNYFEMIKQLAPEIGAQPASVELRCARFPRLRRVVALRGELAGAPAWQDLLRWGRGVSGDDVRRGTGQLSANQEINIQYTSGTTGFPKAATLSHRNLLLNAYYVGACQRLDEQDRICIPVPLYHCFGCVLGAMCACVHGAAMIFPAEHFDAEQTLAASERFRATVIYGVPTMFIAQLQHPSLASRDLSSLRTGIMAGSPCPIEVMRQVIDRLGVAEITIAYGQTEASPVITQTRADDPIELRVKTVGQPLPGLQVKVVDDQGAELPDGEQGELCCRGHAVMLGYYRDRPATRAAIDEAGWLHTGDLAVRQPDSYYRITGRIKDMVIRGGENIFPREIEEYLFQHPSIEQAAVVGLPDEKYGEELCAWVRIKANCELDEEQIRQYCLDGLARYKTPKYVRVVREFPQTVTGKIQKFKIREAMVKELALREIDTA